MWSLLPARTRSSSSSSSPPSPSTSVVLLAAAMTIWILMTSSSNATDLGSRDVIDTCPPSSVNENLREFRRCHPSEFHEVTSCGSERRTLTCAKGRYVAVHSASAGRSRTSADCVQTAITDETDCSVECVVNEVNELCLGKRRCQIGADGMLFSRPCWVSSGSTPEHRFLWLLYACVSKNITKGFHKKITGPLPDEITCSEDPEETTVPTTSSQVLRLQEPTGSIRSRSTTPRPHPTKIHQEEPPTKNGNGSTTKIDQNVEKTSSSVTTKEATEKGTGFPSSLVDLLNPTTTSPQSNPGQRNGSNSNYLDSISELIWILNYVYDNSEKCILYLLIGFFLGVILILVVLILRSLFLNRMSERYQFPAVGVRMTDSSTSLKWRSADSESSVNDDDIRVAPMRSSTGRPWLHDRPYRAWSPPTSDPDQTVSQTQVETKPNGILYASRMEETDPLKAEEIPFHVRTQSLSSGPHPYHNDGSHYYCFSDPKSLTMQPSNRNDIEF